MVKAIGMLQARTQSRRLPGKVLHPILGRPMIEHQVLRLKRSRNITKLVLVTSDLEADDVLVQLAQRLGLPYFRGSLEDVLDRYYRAAIQFDASHIVRLTADCPLTDPELIDRMIRFYSDGPYDYVSNTLVRTYPRGLDAEVFSFEALKSAWADAKDTYDREHVTPFFYGNPSRFKIGVFKDAIDRSQWRWTVDEVEDFAFVSQVYARLFPANPAFQTSDVLRLLDRHPDLVRLEKL